MEDQNANRHPFCPWKSSESQNLRGYLATHAVKNGEASTLCGHSCTGWMWQNWNGEDSHQLVSCKICQRLLTQPSPDESLGISHSVGE
jgi:hypothetical protein